MLAGLMENSYDRMWRFKDFFEYSSEICDLKYINVMNLDTCQIIEIPMKKHLKYDKILIYFYFWLFHCDLNSSSKACWTQVFDSTRDKDRDQQPADHLQQFAHWLASYRAAARRNLPDHGQAASVRLVLAQLVAELR